MLPNPLSLRLQSYSSLVSAADVTFSGTLIDVCLAVLSRVAQRTGACISPEGISREFAGGSVEAGGGAARGLVAELVT